jgi:hypothetical protein
VGGAIAGVEAMIDCTCLRLLELMIECSILGCSPQFKYQKKSWPFFVK